MRTTEVLFNQLDKMKIGVDKLADAVKSTLGPGGQGVIIKRQYSMPFITKDGVTVAQSVFLTDPVEDIGAQLAKEVANKTVEGAGDGTTTATVLAQAIFNKGLMTIKSGVNPVEMKKGMEKAVVDVVRILKEQSTAVPNTDVVKVKQVATISANYDEKIGAMIAEAVSKIGENGYIAAEESSGTESYVKITDGMQLERGYLSPHFINNVEKMLVEFENPYILVTDKRISTFTELIPALEISIKNGKSLLIIADDIEGEALATIVTNKMQGRLSVAAIRCPYTGGNKGTALQDIATVTGATIMSEETGNLLNKVKLEDFGSCEKLTITRLTTVIVKGSGKKEEVAKRIDQIKHEIENAMEEQDKTRLKARLAKIDGGIAIIYVGGFTETEMKERKFRVDDAIYATIAATEEGIVPGGGVAFLNCVNRVRLNLDNKDQQAGANIILEAIKQPIRTIVENKKGVRKVGLFTLDRRGYPEITMDQIALNSGIEKNYGWNARTEEYGCMIEMGIVDPLKVVRLALENASSIVGLLLNTKASIYENSELVSKKVLE